MVRAHPNPDPYPNQVASETLDSAPTTRSAMKVKKNELLYKVRLVRVRVRVS